MRKFSCTLLLLSAIFIILFASCAHIIYQEGKASYYAGKSDSSRSVFSNILHQQNRTAAHRTLPFGTKVKVTNLTNGKSVRVRINDRGPYVEGRIIDVSQKAAKKLKMIRDGIVPVRIKYRMKKN